MFKEGTVGSSLTWPFSDLNKFDEWIMNLLVATVRKSFICILNQLE